MSLRAEAAPPHPHLGDSVSGQQLKGSFWTVSGSANRGSRKRTAAKWLGPGSPSPVVPAACSVLVLTDKPSWLVFWLNFSSWEDHKEQSTSESFSCCISGCPPLGEIKGFLSCSPAQKRVHHQGPFCHFLPLTGDHPLI